MSFASTARRLASIAAISCLIAAAPAREGKTLVLFDGKGLDGWKKTDFYKSVEIKVEDGAIVLPEGQPMAGVTSTRGDLPRLDYELTYEAKRLSGSDFFAAATFPVGPSHLTLVNGGWGGSVTGLSSLNGADASENESNRFVKYRDGIWYRFRVRVTAKVVRAWLDDKELCAVEYEGVQVGTRVESRPSQPLGFATYRSSGSVRKVEVRPLTPAEVAANDRVEK